MLQLGPAKSVLVFYSLKQNLPLTGVVYILSVFSPLFGTGGGGSSSSLSSVFDESEKYDSLSLSALDRVVHCAYFGYNILNALILKTIRGMIMRMSKHYNF